MSSAKRLLSPGHLPELPKNSSIRRLPFSDDALDAIAHELGSPLTLAPFQVRGAAIHRITIPVTGDAVVPGSSPVQSASSDEQSVTTLTLWTSLRRVDAINPWVTVVATGVIAVDLVSGVEAIFRYPGGSVTVARNGRLVVRTGPIPDERDDSRTGGESE